MLKEFNNLAPFFEDNYERIHVRRYADILKCSPPKASKTLKELARTGLLLYSSEFGRDFYVASRNERFIQLNNLYWYQRFESIGLLAALEKHYFNCPIILYGSLAKAEATRQSDVDIAVIGAKTEYTHSGFEKNLKRKINEMHFGSLNKIPKNLLNGILNGQILKRGAFIGLV